MRTFAARALAALALGLAAFAAGAADKWPDRPIKIVIPFPPGGTTDQIARHAQKPLTDILGVPIVIENHGGGSGSIGAGMVAHSAPDGYTFLIVFDTHGVNPSIIPNMSFDTLKDLAPIMLIGTSPMAITAYPTTPYKTFKDVLEDAKHKEGGVSFGTIGAGSLAHLYMTQVSREMKVPLTHVPYRGGGPLVQDAIAGHVPVAIGSAALMGPSIRAGKLRALAVTSAQRFPQLPDVPTVAEQGIPAAESNSWWGLLAPAGTPRPIIERMHDAFAKAMRDPEVNKRLVDQGLVMRLSTPEEFGAFLENEVHRWAKVVKENHIAVGQ
jgi:tripartite-type tricarboxylate transporter receptor subunit TctC